MVYKVILLQHSLCFYTITVLELLTISLQKSIETISTLLMLLGWMFILQCTYKSICCYLLKRYLFFSVFIKQKSVTRMYNKNSRPDTYYFGGRLFTGQYMVLHHYMLNKLFEHKQLNIQSNMRLGSRIGLKYSAITK